MSFKFVEKIYTPQIEGQFDLKILDRDRQVISRLSSHNLVVTQSKSIMAKLLGGDGLSVVKIGLGTGVTEAALTDTGLTDPYYLSFVSVDYPEDPVVRFNWYLAYDELVGVDVSEFGLFTTDDQLFSRRVYTPIPKNADMAFEGAWSIRFYTA